MPLLGGGVRAAILAAHDMAADQFRQLVAGVDAAAPGIGMVVDAGLVELRRIDAVEAVGDIGQLDGVAVLDDGVGGQAGCGPQHCSRQNHQPHAASATTSAVVPAARRTFAGRRRLPAGAFKRAGISRTPTSAVVRLKM